MVLSGRCVCSVYVEQAAKSFEFVCHHKGGKGMWGLVFRSPTFVNCSFGGELGPAFGSISTLVFATALGRFEPLNQRGVI